MTRVLLWLACGICAMGAFCSGSFLLWLNLHPMHFVPKSYGDAYSGSVISFSFGGFETSLFDINLIMSLACIGAILFGAAAATCAYFAVRPVGSESFE